MLQSGQDKPMSCWIIGWVCVDKKSSSALLGVGKILFFVFFGLPYFCSPSLLLDGFFAWLVLSG